MKKRVILPITLAALMILSGCTNKSSNPGSDTAPTTSDTNTGSDVVVNSVSITNKAALQAEWFAGEATRKVAITADPEIESINDLLDDGSIVISSSNPEVVSVNRLMLSAVAAGSATITVTYGGKSDSVEVTVSAVRTAVEKYGTVHKGTAEDPLDNADAVKAAPLAKAAGDTTKYYVKGTVNSFYHAPGSRTDKVVSWYMDAEGTDKKFECYKVLKENGDGLTDDDIWVGAECVVKGVLTDYNGQPETDTAIWVENTGNGAAKPQPKQTISATASEAVTIGKTLQDGSSTWDWYEVTGYVAIAEGTNFWIADEKNSTAAKTDLFELYLGYFSGKVIMPDGSESTLADGLLKNAKVTIKTTVKNYHGQIETDVVDGNVKVSELGEAPAAATVVTVTEALAAGYALAAGATSENLYEFTGKVCKKGTWNDSYKNGDIFVAESETEIDATKMIQVFRVKDQTVFDSLSVGDTAKVTSKLQHYVQTNKETGEVTKDIVETLEGPTVVKVAGSDAGGGSGESSIPEGAQKLEIDFDTFDNESNALPTTSTYNVESTGVINGLPVSLLNSYFSPHKEGVSSKGEPYVNKGYIMMKSKKASGEDAGKKAAVWNTAAFPGKIVSFEVTATSSCSGSCGWVLTLGESAMTGAVTEGTKATGKNGVKATATEENAYSYFNITCETDGYNAQIASITIYYLPNA